MDVRIKTVNKMTTQELLKVSETLSNPYIEAWKKQGKKVMGYYCTDTPEEILHAGGILGFRMRGTEAEGTARADTIMNTFNCSYVRATLDLAMQGRYNFLDGLCVSNSCDHCRRIYDVYNHKIINKVKGLNDNFLLTFLSSPHVITDRGYRWLREEFEILKTNLEKGFNTTISLDDLKESIKIVNQSRILLKEAHQLRTLDKPKLNGVDALKINIASCSIPKENFNNELKDYLDGLKEKEGISDYKARLLITGSIIDDHSVVQLFEEVGGLVTTDVACFGTRNFWDLTEENGDPLDAITKRYYYKISCPRIMDSHDKRLKFLEERIKEANVDGIIGIRIDFCDLNGCENMVLEHELKELDIPFLSLDREYFMGDPNRFQTRIEAFIERIK